MNDSAGYDISATLPEKLKLVLGEAARSLFHIAANSHTLRDLMGIEQTGLGTFKILPVARPWLTPHPLRANEFSFDPDRFRKCNRSLSDGENDMVLWLLNVWNPDCAKLKKWDFDLFAAIGRLDSDNRQAIADWLSNPVWP